jgi:pyruvate/2-oxoglutarate dehydrogenase complex dihydrolipoamide dehydrogenase (E3) component
MCSREGVSSRTKIIRSHTSNYCTENVLARYSDELLDRIHPPAHLFIIGGGYVGCEFAAIYRAFGCQVTLAEKSESLLPSWDENVGALAWN